MNSTPATFQMDARLEADTLPVCELPLSRLRLMNDARWPWLILVPRVADASELIDLSVEQQAQLWAEIARCSALLGTLAKPDKLNVAALGNIVAQLHVHVIARHTTDAAWPAPVWGRGVAVRYQEPASAALIVAINAALTNA